jgi:hypothetical protein
VTLLLLKLTITPVVIAAATYTARRFGPAVGGWLIGLPFTGGPVALFVALDHGADFSRRLCVGLVAGVAAQAAFVVGYYAAARRGAGWGGSMVSATVSFAVAGAIVGVTGLPVEIAAVVSGLALLVGLRIVPRGVAHVQAHSRWELPLRMLLATGLVLAITGFASTLGPGPSGIVTTFPLITTLLAVPAQRRFGPEAAIAILRGLLAGLFALGGFACALVILLTRMPLSAAFGIALALTLLIQLGSAPTVLRRQSALRP